MKVRELLSGPEKWTQGSYVSVHSMGTSYCLLGAIRHCYPIGWEDIHRKVARELDAEGSLVDTVVFEYNDHPRRKFAEIKELVERLDI